MLTLEKLAQRLKQIRENLGYSQDFVAGELGLSRQAIINIESGKRKVDSFELFKLSDLFGVSAIDLINEDKVAVKNFQEAAVFYRKDKPLSDFENKALSDFDKINKDYDFLKSI